MTFKFLGVGFVNLIFGYAVYAGLIYIKLPYAFALFLATVIGVIFNFFSYGRLVFASKGGLDIFVKFISAYTVVYLFNVLLLSVLTHYLLVNPYVGQAICVPPNVLLSWLLMKNWVYVRKVENE